jgi:hypothetical protein
MELSVNVISCKHAVDLNITVMSDKCHLAVTCTEV